MIRLRANLHRLILVATALFGAVAADGAQPASRPVEPVTKTKLVTAQEVLDLGMDKARFVQHAVEITGVVTFSGGSRSWLWVQDGTASVLVVPADGRMRIPVGSKVRVSGVSGAGSFAPYINSATIQVEGKAPFPKPEPVPVAQVAAIQHFGKWVELDGYVRDVAFTFDTLKLLVMRDRSVAAVVVHGVAAEQMPTNWIDARVRVQGLNWSQYGGNLQVVDTNHIQVVTPGRSGLFDLPLTNARALKAIKQFGDERYRVRGTVVHQVVNGLAYLEDEGMSFALTPMALLGNDDTSGRYLQRESTPYVESGKVVEVVGTCEHVGDALNLRAAEFRVVGDGQVSPPRPASARDVLHGRQFYRLVTLRGCLVSQNVTRNGPYQHHTLRVESQGVRFDVVTDLDKPRTLPSLRRDHIIEVTGVCGRSTAGGTAAFFLWLRSPEDIRSVRPSILAYARRYSTALISTGLVALACGGWILHLRRRVAAQAREAAERQRVDAALRELNTQLEGRVAERTGDLERANAELLAAKADLQRALEAERKLGELRGNFVSIVSHEFRTPLGIIMSSSEMLERYLDRLPPAERRQQLESITKAAGRMAGMMRDVLLLSRVDAGQMEFQPVPVELRAFCQRVIGEVRAALGAATAIELACAPDVPLEVLADESLLGHILTNLLVNAAKYSTGKGPARLSLKADGEQVIFEIRDEGVGIPAEDEERLFKPFQRGRNVGKVAGTGLGLVIVKRCVELHGGQITIQSAEHAGTTVRVRLPLIPGTSASAAGEPKAEPENHFS